MKMHKVEEDSLVFWTFYTMKDSKVLESVEVNDVSLDREDVTRTDLIYLVLELARLGKLANRSED
jgi:hypothetical protein